MTMAERELIEGKLRSVLVGGWSVNPSGRVSWVGSGESDLVVEGGGRKERVTVKEKAKLREISPCKNEKVSKKGVRNNVGEI